MSSQTMIYGQSMPLGTLQLKMLCIGEWIGCVRDTMKSWQSRFFTTMAILLPKLQFMTFSQWFKLATYTSVCTILQSRYSLLHFVFGFHDLSLSYCMCRLLDQITLRALGIKRLTVCLHVFIWISCSAKLRDNCNFGCSCRKYIITRFSRFPHGLVRRVYVRYSSPQPTTLINFVGLPSALPWRSIMWTTFIPSMTCPTTTKWPSSHCA